jgi:hypothetical protein
VRESFDEFLNELYNAPEKPGWIWSDEKIIAFIAERFPDYKPGVIRQYIKRIKAK